MLESLFDKNPYRHVVLGVLHIDLLRNTLASASRTLLDRFESLSLKIVNDTEPTHFQTGAHPSLIDLFATNPLGDVSFFTQAALPSCRTFHDLIYSPMRFPVSQTMEGSVYHYRDYSRIDIDCLLGEKSAYDWSPMHAVLMIKWIISI
jgi:hypothetical protein